MIYSNIASNHYANVATNAGSSSFGAWLMTALRRLVVPSAKIARPPDRVREAAEVRAWAATVARTDPRFAADLFAAADRHETTMM